MYERGAGTAGGTDRTAEREAELETIGDVETAAALGDFSLDDLDGPGTLADHDLPRIRMIARNYEPGRIARKPAAYTKRAVDAAVRDCHTVLRGWADDKGYDIETHAVKMYEEPLEDDLRRFWRGTVHTDGPDVGVRIGTDRSVRSIIRSLDLLEAEPARMGKNDMLRAEADGFDARAAEDYAELYYLTESVLTSHGDLAVQEPVEPFP